MKSHTKDYLALQGIVLLFSLTAIFGKLIELPVAYMVTYRTFTAATIIGILFYIKRPEKLTLKHLTHLLPIGAVLGIHWLLFFGSARLASVSLSLITVSTTTFFTSILEPLVKKHKWNIQEMILGILIVCGMGLIFQAESVHALGITVGLISAFMGAIYMTANSVVSKKYSSMTVNFLQLSGAFLICLPVALWYQPRMQLIIPSSMDLVYLAILSILCTVVPYLILVSLLSRLSAFTVNLSINLEPVYGILLALALFGEDEQMKPGFYIGGAIILFAVIWNAIQERKNRRTAGIKAE